MSSALRNYNKTVTSNGFVKNQVTDKTRLERFLILGTDGGTFYVAEKELTESNVKFLVDLIKKDAQFVLDVVEDVSLNGRAYRNSAAIFTLALVLNHGDNGAKSRAAHIAPSIARTATMVYELAQYIDNMGGWGRAKRRAVANWFTSKTPDQLGYQAVKFRQRNGWTLRDLMRLSHPVGVDQNVGNFILGKGMDWLGVPILNGFSDMQHATTVDSVLQTLDRYPSLPWETIPTQFLKDPKVWKVLFYNNSLTGQALIRNVVRLTRIGAFDDTTFKLDYINKMVDKDMIKKTRLHPVQYLLGSIVYDKGQKNRDAYSYGDLRKKDWTTDHAILAAFDAGFYASFGNVDTSVVPTRIGVDVSSSMSWGLSVGSDVTAAEGAAAMAVVLARSFEHVEILGFANTLKDLQITNQDTLATVMKKTSRQNFGATNPSLLFNDMRGFENFLVVTDNEVNGGRNSAKVIQDYRQKTGIDAKLVVMGMTATDFTIADPNDKGMLDVVGFDANAPKVVTDFMNGKF